MLWIYVVQLWRVCAIRLHNRPIALRQYGQRTCLLLQGNTARLQLDFLPATDLKLDEHNGSKRSGIKDDDTPHTEHTAAHDNADEIRQWDEADKMQASFDDHDEFGTTGTKERLGKNEGCRDDGYAKCQKP